MKTIQYYCIPMASDIYKYLRFHVKCPRNSLFYYIFSNKKKNFLAPSTTKKRLKELASQGKLFMK